MTTILGHHIKLIRPEKIKMPVVLKKDRPVAKYNKKPIAGLCGKVFGVIIETHKGNIYSMPRGTHIQVMAEFNLEPEDVKATGWLLESGEFIWR